MIKFSIVLTLLNVFVSCDKIIQAQLLFRHGARNQIYKNWNWQPYENIMEFLTPVGQRQHYVLGQWLRNRYIDDTSEFKLLKPNLDQNEIRVSSTDVNRTIMSALSNLYGFYPLGTGPTLPANVDASLFLPPNPNMIVPDIGLRSTPLLFQPVPIHMVPKEHDSLLRSYDIAACPMAVKFQQLNAQSDSYKSVENYSKPLKQRYGREVGLSTEEISQLSIVNLSNLQDTFVVDTFNGYPLPADLSAQTLKDMQRLYITQLNLVLYQTWSQVRIMSTPFLQQVLLNMENIISGTEKTFKFHMYSAHDTTVLLMLNALNQTSSECQVQAYLNQPVSNPDCIITYPGFASNLIFELFQDDNNKNYVKILYNGSYINPCQQYNSKQCDYTTFKSNLESQFVNFQVGCGVTLNQNTETQAPTWIWVLFAISIIIAFASLFFACTAFQKWKNVTANTVYVQQA